MMQRRQPDNTRRKRWAFLIILLLAVVLAVVLIGAIRRLGQPDEASAVRLPCLAGQRVTPFGEYVLYYDGAAIHCITVTGAVRWSLPIGIGADFSVSDKSVVAWVGSQVYILDQNGRTTFNDNLGRQVQFARIGQKYAAAVIGEDTSPGLVIRDLNGEHSILLATLEAIRARGALDAETRTLLSRARAALVAHLDKEEREFYPVMRAAAEQSEALRETLRVMGQEMDAIAASALSTIDSWIGGTGGADHADYASFSESFDAFVSLLTDRIQREERSLYAKYLKLTARAGVR